MLILEPLPDLVPDPVITFKSMFVFKRKLKDMSCALEEGCASSSAFKVVKNSSGKSYHVSASNA